MDYYQIITIADRRHSIFDTIETVALFSGTSYNDVLSNIGFKSNVDVLVYFSNHEHDKHFNQSAFMTRKLNKVCKKLNLPLRIVRPTMDCKRRTNK